jgi:Phage gp6-like head-tail connector protein
MLKLVTGPATELITLPDAKLHLKVTNTVDDSLITALIIAAREKAENLTGRSFITQSWELWLNGFPHRRGSGESWWDGTREGSLSQLYSLEEHFSLEKAPVQAVQALTSYGLDDTAAVFPSANYYVDTVSTPGRICLNYGQVWPVPVRRHNAVQVQFTVGYGDAATSVPGAIVQAVRLIVAHLYEHRGDAAEFGQTGKSSAVIPTTARELLDPYRIRRLG